MPPGKGHELLKTFLTEKVQGRIRNLFPSFYSYIMFLLSNINYYIGINIGMDFSDDKKIYTEAIEESMPFMKLITFWEMDIWLIYFL